ncbi:MAG: PAS domain S-box protein [Rhodocyclaceae bacterium]|nr:PAS domain S-box protein [Rhodocyclaceae bacterium]
MIQDEVVQYANAVFNGLTGHAPEEISGMHIRDPAPPSRSEDCLQRICQLVSGEIPSMSFRTKGWHRDGDPVDVEVHGSCVIYRGRLAVAGVAISIAANVRFEQDLGHSPDPGPCRRAGAVSSIHRGVAAAYKNRRARPPWERRMRQ